MGSEDNYCEKFNDCVLSWFDVRQRTTVNNCLNKHVDVRWVRFRPRSLKVISTAVTHTVSLYCQVDINTFDCVIHVNEM